ncbi:hypothetical protein VTN49DRAFT_430 [Thermomyces lanuginosus]|uniref:uncharacterized protein n=1 Tax=Thermomyces lanuginosus TaxID=5541 RepID=UPI00374402A7
MPTPTGNDDAAGAARDARHVTRYAMSRAVQTVPELWAEWTEGLGGKPSIQTLTACYGTEWRGDPKEKTFFCRRKKIITEIERRHRQ